jgi:cytidyltransferase-like protein
MITVQNDWRKEMKKYKCGLYIGRFQPLHVGHTHIIAKMLEECETVIVAIGSSQEYHTKRNPIPFVMRRIFILECFPTFEERLHIVPIPDREKVSNDASWGDYVFEKIYNQCELVPNAIYEGEEVERATWYDNLNVDIIKVPRTIIPVSATEIREGLLAGNDEVIRRYIPYGIRGRVEYIKEEIEKCRN